jgi:hypothetical protein
MSLSSQKYEFGIRDPEKTFSGSQIPDPGVKKAPDPGSQHCKMLNKINYTGIINTIHYPYQSDVSKHNRCGTGTMLLHP